MKKTCFSLSLLMAMAIAFPAWNAIAEDVEGLVLYLPFEEAEPIDHSPDPAEVSIRGELKSVDGMFGKAMAFDGKGANYVEIDHADKLEGMDALTIEAWVKQNPGKGELIVSKRIEWQQADSYNLGNWKSAEVLARTNGNFGRQINSVTILEFEKWYHLAYVFDGNADQNERQKLYVNGVLEATKDHPDISVGKGEAPLYIGIMNIPASFSWNGLIDEVSIWNRALSEDEIKLAMEGPIMSTQVELQGKLATTWGEMKRR